MLVTMGAPSMRKPRAVWCGGWGYPIVTVQFLAVAMLVFYRAHLLAGNTGELLLMAVCIVIGLPVPLLPIHLLWINLVTDGLPALCLATDSRSLALATSSLASV